MAMKSYGIANFKIEEIDSASSLAELNSKETYWILHFNSVLNGYNLETGGNGKIVSDETRKLLSKAGKGRKISQKQIDSLVLRNSVAVYQYDKNGEYICYFSSSVEASKATSITNSEIGKVCKGKRRLAGNFQWRYEKKDKIEAVKKIKKISTLGKRAPNARYVGLLDIHGKVVKKYETAKLAASLNNCDHSLVVKVCNGKIKKTKGFVFIYLDRI